LNLDLEAAMVDRKTVEWVGRY